MNRAFFSVTSLFTTLISLVACDCIADEPSFITATGEFELFHKQMTVKVFATPESSVNYTVTRGPATVGPAKPPIHKNSDWFIYPATADTVWAYHGGKDILLIEFSDKGSKFTDNSVVPDLLQRAPAAFRDRLPKEIKIAGRDTQASRFVGEWTNKDFETPSVTRVHIRQDGDKITVHEWGRCHPKECDWGDATATAKGSALSVTWKQGFAVQTQELTLLADGSLQVVTHTHFTDNSGRKDFDSKGTFAKGLVHDWSDPTQK